MIETAANARIAEAYRTAHCERGAVLAGFVKWLLGKTQVPLGDRVLTEPSRCA